MHDPELEAKLRAYEDRPPLRVRTPPGVGPGSTQTPPPPAPPWERRGGESAPAFAAFERYRRLSPEARSLRRAWEEARTARGKPRPGPVAGHWTRWCTDHQWSARALAWDEEVASQARAEEVTQALEARREAQEEQRRQTRLREEEARRLRAAGDALVRRLCEDIEAGGLAHLRAADLLRHLPKIAALVATGRHLERLSRRGLAEDTGQDRSYEELVARIKDVVPYDRRPALASLLMELARAAEG